MEGASNICQDDLSNVQRISSKRKKGVRYVCAPFPSSKSQSLRIPVSRFQRLEFLWVSTGNGCHRVLVDKGNEGLGTRFGVCRLWVREEVCAAGRLHWPCLGHSSVLGQQRVSDHLDGQRTSCKYHKHWRMSPVNAQSSWVQTVKLRIPTKILYKPSWTK